MKVPIDFNRLKLWNGPSGRANVSLMDRVLELFPEIPDDDGVHDVDLDMISLPIVRQQLQEFYTASNPPPKREPIVDPNEIAKDEFQRKRNADEKAGLARLQQYMERGLIDNQHNADAIRQFLEEHPQIQGIVTPSTVDAAISHLGKKGSNTLQWKSQTPPQTPPPPQPTQPAEQLGWLPNGEKQISLHSSEAELKKASAEQIKDWIRRTREATGQLYIRPKGSFGAKLSAGLVHGREIEQSSPVTP